MVDLRRVKEQLEKYRQSAEYKKNIILGKLTDFVCELEMLHKTKKTDLQFDLMTLDCDIALLKGLISNMTEHYEWLQLKDLEMANEIHRRYKHLIKKL